MQESKLPIDWSVDIAVAHHGKHHLYHTAIAYDQINRLGAFVTQRYVARPERILWTVPLLGKRGNKVKKAASYHHPKLDGKVILHCETPLQAIAARLVGQKRVVSAPGHFEDVAADTCLKNGWGCHSHVTGSLGIFPRLKNAGLPCLLEMYIGDKTLAKEFLSDELERLGLPSSEKFLHEMGCSSELAEKSRQEMDLADYIYCPSEFVINTMRESGVPNSKIVFAPYGVDPGSCAVSPNARKESEIFKVAFVGTEGVRKGLFYAIEAFRQLGPQFELHIFGLEKFEVPKLAFMPTNVIFHGFTAKAKLLSELSTMHAGILVSLWEGSAIGAFDLLSQGLPMVVTFNSGTMVTDGQEGFIVPVRDSGAIQSALVRWQDDESLRFEMGEKAIQLTHKYPWDDYQKKTVAPLQLNSR